MKVYHNTRDPFCRSPFGALAQNAYVDLSLYLYDCPEIPERVYLDYAYGLNIFSYGSSRIKSKDNPSPVPNLPQDDLIEFKIRLRVPATTGLLFYSFKLQMRDGSTMYVLRRDEESGMSMLTYDAPNYENLLESRRAFQITIYDSKQKTPDDLKGKIMYQIFPDRFFRDLDFTERSVCLKTRKEQILHKDWQEDVDIEGHPSTGYIACDFYGGSLEGIRQKLDYLSSLSISIIYLNPIFYARSNHRYDAADYELVDPLLGTNSDFQRLCAEAASRNIKIIIDASFSHTGADSKYFNKYSRFDVIGAYQDAQGRGVSDFYSWYNFYRDENKQLAYDSWWGFPDLPSVNENDLNFREYILGDQGVVRKWLRLGAAGFRLDVSDELPDDFLRDLYLTVKSEKNDALILGEVWEDASNKISYGSYRDFIYGHTHDSVMGYPFRNSMIDFFRGHIDAARLNNRLENLRENYPPEIFAISMNLLGSHDVPRFITSVAGEEDPGDRKLQQKIKLNDEQRRLGLERYILASAFQLAYPGMPSIYYGDEIGMEGYRDPFNRRPFEWHNLKKMEAFSKVIKRMAELRKNNTVLQTGYYRTSYAENSIFIFERFGRAEEDAFHYPIKGAKRAAIIIVKDNSKIDYEFAGEIYTVNGPAALWILDRNEYYFSLTDEIWQEIRSNNQS